MGVRIPALLEPGKELLLLDAQLLHRIEEWRHELKLRLMNSHLFDHDFMMDGLFAERIKSRLSGIAQGLSRTGHTSKIAIIQ